MVEPVSWYGRGTSSSESESESLSQEDFGVVEGVGVVAGSGRTSGRGSGRGSRGGGSAELILGVIGGDDAGVLLVKVEMDKEGTKKAASGLKEEVIAVGGGGGGRTSFTAGTLGSFSSI